MEINIKKATIEHLKDIQNLNYQLCKKENKEFDSTIIPTWPLSKKGKEYFKQKIIKNSNCAFVAIVNRKIVGYLVGGLSEKEGYRNISNLVELENMFVLEEFRNLGIGANLYRAFTKWCKSKKVKKQKVIVSAQNIKAINFYKNNKFKDYSLILEK